MENLADLDEIIGEIDQETLEIHDISLNEHTFDDVLFTDYFTEVENVLNQTCNHTHDGELSLKNFVTLFFGPDSHWMIEMKKVISIGLHGMKKDQLGMNEVYAFLEFVGLLHIYNESASNLVKNRDYYSQPIMNYDRFSTILRSFGYVQQSLEGQEWHTLYTPKTNFKRAVSLFSQMCSEIGSTPKTSYCVDDDKIGHHSSNLEVSEGLSFIYHQGSVPGPVNHLVNSEQTSFILAVQPHYVRMTNEDCVKELFQHIPETDGFVFLDKGYTTRGILDFFATRKMKIIGTLANNRGLAYSFTKQQGVSNLRILSLDGPAMALFSRVSLPNAPLPLYEMAFRNGYSNGGVLMLTNDENFGSASWTYETAAKPNSPEPDPFFFTTNPTIDGSILHLTLKKGGCEWFILRRFRFTSLVSSSILHYLSFHQRMPQPRPTFNAQQLEIYKNLFQLLGTELTNMSGQRIDKAEALKLCNKYSIQSNQRIEEMRAILNLGVGECHRSAIYSIMINKWFLQPKTQDYDKALNKIEPIALNHFISTVKSLKYADVAVELMFYSVGLVSNQSMFYLASTCSGILVEDEELSLVVVIPSSVTENVLNLRGKPFHELLVENEYEEFHLAVPSSEIRARVLHDCSTFGLRSVFCVEATESKIQRILQVTFSEEHLERYRTFIKLLYKKFLQWLYLPVPAIPHDLEFNGVDQETFMHYFALSKALERKILEAHHPFQPIRALKPALIQLWNRGKGRVDETTRYLSDIKESVLSHFTSEFLPWHRLILYSIVNIYHLLRLSLIKQHREQFENKSISFIKKSISDRITFKQFLKVLRKTLIDIFNNGQAVVPVIPNILAQPVSTSTSSLASSLLKKRALETIVFPEPGAYRQVKVNFFNSCEMIAIRKDPDFTHELVKTQSKGHCIICHARSYYNCKSCQAFLCLNSNCSNVFHLGEKLPV